MMIISTKMIMLVIMTTMTVTGTMTMKRRKRRTIRGSESIPLPTGNVSLEMRTPVLSERRYKGIQGQKPK